VHTDSLQPAGRYTRRMALQLATAATILGARSAACADTRASSSTGQQPARAESTMRTPIAAVITPPQNPNFPLPPSWETEVRELAPNVYAYIQGGGPGKSNVGRSNAMFIVGKENIFLVDALAAPLHTKAMVAAIRRVSDKPFRFVVNSHYHPDHVFGNQFIPDRPDVISSPFTRQQVLPMVSGPAHWEAQPGWANGDEERRILPATITIEGKTTVYAGDVVIELLPLAPAHTYGDVAVYLPQLKVMALGDIGFFYVAPFCISGNPSEWLKVCDRIEQMDVDTMVPGHGPVGGKAQLAEMADYLRVLRMEAKKRYDARLTPGAAAADISLGKFDNWVGPEQIVMNVVRFYMEFDGTLGPAANLLGTNAAVQEYNSIVRGRGAK